MAIIRKDFRYKIIKGFFNKSELNLLQTYCIKELENPVGMRSQKNDDCFAVSFYEDRLMQTLLQTKLPLVEKECGLKLWTTYAYWRYYGFNAFLKMHRDRPSCEISITACINKTDNWPLIINEKEIEIDIGDGVLYLGVEDLHGRPGTYKGDGMAQVFFHYVDQRGPFIHHRDDNYLKTTTRPASSADKDYQKNIVGINGTH